MYKDISFRGCRQRRQDIQYKGNLLMYQTALLVDNLATLCCDEAQLTRQSIDTSDSTDLDIKVVQSCDNDSQSFLQNQYRCFLLCLRRHFLTVATRMVVDVVRLKQSIEADIQMLGVSFFTQVATEQPRFVCRWSCKIV